MNFNQAIPDEIDKVKIFKSWYILMNKKCPNQYPLTLPEGHCGVWSEQIADFNPNDTEVLKTLASLGYSQSPNSKSMEALNISEMIVNIENGMIVQELIFGAYDISEDNGWVYVRVAFVEERYIISPHEKRSVISNISATSVNDTVTGISEILMKLIN